MELKIKDIIKQEPVYRFELNYMLVNDENNNGCTIAFDFKKLEPDIEKLITVLSKIDENVEYTTGLGKDDVKKLFNDGFIDSSDVEFINKFEEENEKFIGPIFMSELETGEQICYYSFVISYMDEYGSRHEVEVEEENKIEID